MDTHTNLTRMLEEFIISSGDDPNNLISLDFWAVESPGHPNIELFSATTLDNFYFSTFSRDSGYLITVEPIRGITS